MNTCQIIMEAAVADVTQRVTIRNRKRKKLKNKKSNILLGGNKSLQLILFYDLNI